MKEILILSLLLTIHPLLTLSQNTSSTSHNDISTESSIPFITIDDLDRDYLKVAIISNRKPFSLFSRTAEMNGFSIDLWEAIAERLDYKYVYVVYDDGDSSPTDLLEAVESGEVDVAIGPISKTEAREKRIDFTHTVFKSGMGLVVKSESQNIILRAVTSHTFLSAVCVIYMIIFVVAHLFWCFEHGKLETMKEGYFSSIWVSMWWTSVTLTTVGYGDIVPRTKGGNIVGFCWMFSGIVIIGIISGAVSSLLTIGSLQGSRISVLTDLRGDIIVTIEDTTADYYLRDTPIDVITTHSVDNLFELLENDSVQAIFYDYPILEYYLSVYQERYDNMIMVNTNYSPQDYGMIVRSQSSLKENIDLTILWFEEEGITENFYRKWFTFPETIDSIKLFKEVTIIATTVFALLIYTIGYYCANTVAKKEKKKE